MDEALATTLSAQLTTFKTDALEQIGVVLPIALGVLISVALVYKAIGMFRSVAHV